MVPGIPDVEHVDHDYGLQSENHNELRVMLLQQKRAVECLIEREEEIVERLRTKDQEVAELQIQCYKKDGEISRMELELLSQQQRNQWLHAQLRAAHEKIKEVEAGCARAAETPLSYDSLVRDPKELQYYTGFTSPVLLDNFYKILEPDMRHLQFWQSRKTDVCGEERKFLVPLKDQLILTLVRLRHGFDGADLARRLVNFLFGA